MVLSEYMRVVLLIVCLEMSCLAFSATQVIMLQSQVNYLYTERHSILRETLILFSCPSVVFSIPTSFYMTVLI
jgi:hypothetical protein